MYRFPAISHRSRKSAFRTLTTKRGARFGPAQILALTPAAWFRLNVGITVATGVSIWADQSGNGRDLLQGTGGNQPAKQADGSILFDGVAHYLKCTGFTLNQPTTVYFLGKHVTWVQNQTVFDGNTTNALRFFDVNIVTSSPQMQIRTTAVVPSPTGDVNLAVNTYGAVACVFNGASSILQVNRNAPSTGDAGATNAGGFTLGAAGGALVFGNIQVMEVILFPAAHDQATRNNVIRYLAKVGGVSV